MNVTGYFSGLIFLTIAGVAVLIVVCLLFNRKTIMRTVGLSTLGTSMLIASLAYTRGVFGTSVIFITIPLTVVLGMSCLYYLLVILKKPLLKHTELLNTLSKGDLNVEVGEKDKKMSNELGQMSVSLDNIVNRFREIVIHLKSTSNTLLDSGDDIQNSAIYISESASSQASSVEEITTAIEEMTAGIYQNAENSKKSEATAVNIVKKMKQMEKMSTEMVNKISQIASEVKIIREIAEQTNILSLNAAVEAARAGEQGKGFAVVAGEVRKLAESSKIAAEKISEITTQGVDIVKNVVSELNDITPDIEITANILSEISMSSMEQRVGADQINQSINTINTSSQQNAEASEKLVNNAENIANLSKQLNEIVSFFQYENEMLRG